MTNNFYSDTKSNPQCRYRIRQELKKCEQWLANKTFDKERSALLDEYVNNTCTMSVLKKRLDELSELRDTTSKRAKQLNEEIASWEPLIPPASSIGRAAILSRVSTWNQVRDGGSLNYQVDDCLEKARELGYFVDEGDIYRELAVSSECPIDYRPELTQILQLVEQGYYKALMVRTLDRLCRNETTYGHVKFVLDLNGARLIVLGNPALEAMLFEIYSEMKEQVRSEVLREMGIGSGL